MREAFRGLVGDARTNCAKCPDFLTSPVTRFKDMVGHVAEFMCDQVGSRYLQEHVLEHPSQTDCDLIYEEVCPVILQLSVDVFANFCVQRLLEKASEEQVNSMAKALKGSVLRLALQTYGCRVVQKVRCRPARNESIWPSRALKQSFCADILAAAGCDQTLSVGHRGCLARKPDHDPQRARGLRPEMRP